MKILFTAAEVAPFVKVGGLADVAGSLPQEISKLGHEIKVFLPAYGSINLEKHDIKPVENSNIIIELGGKQIPVSLKKTTLPNSNVEVYFVDNFEYFSSYHDVYPQQTYYRFEQERFITFCKAVLELIKVINFQPNVIHCNDWHTAPIPVFLKTVYKDSNFHKNISTAFSIHNLSYQGLYSPNVLEFAGLNSKEVFTTDKLEFYGDVNWMKGGIIYSEKINTVSEKYATEIQTPEYGDKLEGVLREYNYKLTGILNGLDYNIWNPQTDKIIAKNYSPQNLKGKAECKNILKEECGFTGETSDTPLIGIVSRMAVQKGFNILAEIIDELKLMDIQIVILGSGEKEYEKFYKDSAKTSKNIKVFVGYDAKLANMIYAGSDMFLMPSRFEPCGLGQLIALKYGSVPIVRATGGLADTIIDYDVDNENSNGFVFRDYNSAQLLTAIKRAVSLFKNDKKWTELMVNSMNCDFSWKTSAVKYISLYTNAKKA